MGASVRAQTQSRGVVGVSAYRKRREGLHLDYGSRSSPRGAQKSCATREKTEATLNRWSESCAPACLSLSPPGRGSGVNGAAKHAGGRQYSGL